MYIKQLSGINLGFGETQKRCDSETRAVVDEVGKPDKYFPYFPQKLNQKLKNLISILFYSQI